MFIILFNTFITNFAEEMIFIHQMTFGASSTMKIFPFYKITLMAMINSNTTFIAVNML